VVLPALWRGSGTLQQLDALRAYFFDRRSIANWLQRAGQALANDHHRVRALRAFAIHDCGTPVFVFLFPEFEADQGRGCGNLQAGQFVVGSSDSQGTAFNLLSGEFSYTVPPFRRLPCILFVLECKQNGKSMSVTLDFDEQALASLPFGPGERERHMQIELACRFYASGWLTLAQGATMAHLDHFAFGVALAERGIPRQYGITEAQEDLAHARRQ